MIRVQHDPALDAEVSLTYDGDTLVLTFGNVEPSDTGAWGIVVHAMRQAALR